MSIELMEPVDKTDMSNPVARRLAKSGEGFYHLALVTEDVEASGNALAERSQGIDTTAAWTAEAFVLVMRTLLERGLFRRTP
jgi:hypothetical protein